MAVCRSECGDSAAQPGMPAARGRSGARGAPRADALTLGYRTCRHLGGRVTLEAAQGHRSVDGWPERAPHLHSAGRYAPADRYCKLRVYLCLGRANLISR